MQYQNVRHAAGGGGGNRKGGKAVNVFARGSRGANSPVRAGKKGGGRK